MLAKGVSEDPTALAAYHALEAATLNGAKALGMEDQIGSIEAGKQADLVAVDLLSHAATQPVYHPVSKLVYSATRNQVTDVWVAGSQKVNNGSLIDLDAKKILSDAEQWQQKITG